MRARLEWIQPLDRWTVLYYQHSNAVGIDGEAFAVEPDTIVIFAPGVRGTNARCDDDTHHYFLTFSLPSQTGEQFAIPLIHNDMQRVFRDFDYAVSRVAYLKQPAIAFAWNLMWSIAQNRAVMREARELYIAEDWIYRHLNEKIPMAELAEAAGVSRRHLLAAFWREHRCSIQEFIQRMRVQEATRLLSTTDIAIKEVAARVGMPDLQAFNKLIRLRAGCSPRVFREVARAKIDQ
jgi:transcriptional regulator GlxA family with amidase domain